MRSGVNYKLHTILLMQKRKDKKNCRKFRFFCVCAPDFMHNNNLFDISGIITSTYQGQLYVIW